MNYLNDYCLLWKWSNKMAIVINDYIHVKERSHKSSARCKGSYRNFWLPKETKYGKLHIVLSGQINLPEKYRGKRLMLKVEEKI